MSSSLWTCNELADTPAASAQTRTSAAGVCKGLPLHPPGIVDEAIADHCTYYGNLQ